MHEVLNEVKFDVPLHAISKLIIIHKLYHVSFYVTPCARK